MAIHGESPDDHGGGRVGWGLSSTARLVDVRDTPIRRDHIVIVGEHVPQTQTGQLGQFLTRSHGLGLILAPYFLQRWLRQRRDVRLRRTVPTIPRTPQPFHVAVQLQSLFKHALNRRMKARQQGRPFPTV